MNRRWGPIATGVALALTFLVLVLLGTAGGPDRPAQAGEGPEGQGKAAPLDWMRKLQPGEKPPQFVLFSFDGAASHEHWERILPLARKVNAHVTGFLSGIYLLPDHLRGTYSGPGHGAGRASISFGGTDAEVATRIKDLNAVLADGHEIGTHFNGHFCAGNEPSGGVWSRADWTSELDQFFDIVRQSAARGLRVPEDEIKGGRIPCLEGDPNAFLPVMASRAMTYDTSLTTDGVAWPSKKDGMWEFWVPVVKVPALGNKMVTMQDYNLWYAMNGAKEEPGKDAELTAATLDTYRAAYQAAYNTNRAPLTIGNHFNDWSGGAFSLATEQFMNEVCVRANTVCATYTEVLDWMKLQDPAVLDAFRNKPHAQVS
jgi:hypothetical protein